MATQLQIRRGTSTQVAAFTGAEGEIVVNTTNDSVHVNDGSTAGGFEMARADLNNVSDTDLNAALTGNTVSALTITTLTLGATAITATGTELNYVDGVTSAIQTQIDTKAPLASPAFTGTVTADGLTVDTDTLVVDATNNRVGIGTSSPNALLHLSSAGSTVLNVEATGANDSRLRITSGNSNISYIEFADPDDADTGEIRYEHATNNMQFRTAGNVERMRLSGGNLLVGTTDTAPGAGDTNEGFSINSSRVFVSRASDYSLSLNRNTDDGPIALFRKSGSSIGSISVASGNNLTIDGLVASHAGLEFGTGRITPRVAGATADNAVDLGYSTQRFQDLFLSGGVYLGGTGTANHLDSYEKGVFTPSITGASSPSYAQRLGSYVKIGSYVWFSIDLQLSSGTATSSHLTFTGLPFTSAASSTNAFGSASWSYGNMINENALSAGTLGMHITWAGSNAIGFYYGVSQVLGTSAGVNMTNRAIISGTYRTDQ